MTIAVDFDGVIHAYTKGWQDGTIYDPPLPGALDGLRALAATHAVCIFTTRDAEPVAGWLRVHGIAAHTEREMAADGEPVGTFWDRQDIVLVTNRKLAAVAYLDDRAVRFTTWDQALADLLPADTAEQGAPTTLVDDVEAAEHKANYLGACKTIAEMHQAAVGEKRGPIRGVIEDVADVRTRALDAEQERDGAYRERAQLLAWLAALHPTVLAPAPDCDEPGWWIVYVTTTAGQLSWHISPRDADLFTHVERVDPGAPRATWDGHTTEEKYQRIRHLIAADASTKEH